MLSSFSIFTDLSQVDITDLSQHLVPRDKTFAKASASAVRVDRSHNVQKNSCPRGHEKNLSLGTRVTRHVEVFVKSYNYRV